MRMKLRLVLVAVRGSLAHCRDDCTYLVKNEHTKNTHCVLFNAKLSRDERRKNNSSRRLKLCKVNEHPPEVTDR